MNRFEIINDIWIEKKKIGEWEDKFVLDALKIDDIKRIYCTHEPKGYDSPERYLLHIEISSGISMCFSYNGEEVDEFEVDLSFLKKRLVLGN